MSALGRLFGSSTWWSALLSLIVTVVCKANGIDVEPAVAAAVPLAVGVKEAARHYGNGVGAAAAARLNAASEAIAAAKMLASRTTDDPSNDLAQAAARSRFAPPT